MMAIINDAHCCFICDQPFQAGEMVLSDVNEGLGHRACFGDDREGYVKDIDTGEPLGADDPIPAGEAYDPADYPEFVRNAQSEAVAWRVDVNGLSHIWNVERNARDDAQTRGGIVEPLYTHPAPPLAEPSPTVVAALRMMTCPRPCNYRPDDFDVGQCFDAGECGCVAGNALAHSAPLAATDAMVERAAKGLYEADDVWNVAFHWPDLAEGQTTADTYRRLARAALTAALEAKQ